MISLNTKREIIQKKNHGRERRGKSARPDRYGAAAWTNPIRGGPERETPTEIGGLLPRRPLILKRKEGHPHLEKRDIADIRGANSSSPGKKKSFGQKGSRRNVGKGILSAVEQHRDLYLK